MYSNLKNGSVFKDLLLKKLSYAVICSVLLQISIVMLYVFVINFSVYPTIWCKSVFSTFTSFNTWLYLLLFASIIFAQIVICAKEYVLKPTYRFTRFQTLASILCIRTFVLGFLHILVGGIAVWLYLSLSKDWYNSLLSNCETERYCLSESGFFMISNGLWTGLYFFIRIYSTQRNLVFPVIYQQKILHFKGKFIPLLRQSRDIAFYPVMFYFILYYSFGTHVYNLFAFIFNFHAQNEGVSVFLYGFVWLYTVLYIVNMNLMRFFFELFLTEPIEHPVMAVYDSDTSLSEALLVNSVPILQHLACLDLYLLSIWSPQRRQALFTLSQPGGHPHTWNRLVQGAVKLMSEFTETLNKSIDALLTKEEKPKSSETVSSYTSTSFIQQNPLQAKYENMRNMALLSPVQQMDVINLSQDGNTQYTATHVPSENLAQFTNALKNIRVIKYIFGELPDAHIKHCLKNGQIIAWTTQGLANIIVASLKEDPYGIVQKDLPILITCFVQLKQSLEKLNKVAIYCKRGPNFDEFSCKMKNNVNAAVRRSLCNICRTFNKYLNDISLKKDIATQLQCYL